MNNREWFTRREVRLSPDEQLLSDSDLAAIRRCFVTIQELMPTPDGPYSCEFIIIGETNSSGIPPISINKTYDGENIVTVPVSRIFIMHEFAVLLACARDRLTSKQNITVSANDFEAMEYAMRLLVATAKSEELRFDAEQIVNVEIQAGLARNAITANAYATWPPGRLFWADMTESDKFELVRRIRTRLQFLFPKRPDSNFYMFGGDSIVFSAIHEAAHVLHGHFAILRDFESETPTTANWTFLPPPTSVLLHQLRRKKITVDSGWPSSASEDYQQIWLKLKEFQADWHSLRFLVREAVSIPFEDGDHAEAYERSIRILWGLLLTFSSVLLVDAIEDGLGLSILRPNHLGDELRTHPRAELRLAVLISQFVEFLPFEIDFNWEIGRYLESIFLISEELGWSGFRVLAGAPCRMMQKGGIQSEQVSFWIKMLRAAEADGKDLFNRIVN